MRPPTVMPPPLTASPRIGRPRTRGLLPRRRRRRRPTIPSAGACRRRRRRRQRRTRLEAASRWRAPPSPRRPRTKPPASQQQPVRGRRRRSRCGPPPTRSRRRRSRSTRRPTSSPISCAKRWEGRWSSCSVGRAAAAATPPHHRHPKRGGCAGTRAGRWRRSGCALRSSFCRGEPPAAGGFTDGTLRTAGGGTAGDQGVRARVLPPGALQPAGGAAGTVRRRRLSDRARGHRRRDWRRHAGRRRLLL